MSIFLNNVEIPRTRDVTFNGLSIANKVFFNGVEVWRSGPVLITNRGVLEGSPTYGLPDALNSMRYVRIVDTGIEKNRPVRIVKVVYDGIWGMSMDLEITGWDIDSSTSTPIDYSRKIEGPITPTPQTRTWWINETIDNPNFDIIAFYGRMGVNPEGWSQSVISNLEIYIEQ